MIRHYLALDLAADPAQIAEYQNWYKKENLYPEITKSILDAGIEKMEIYRTGNRIAQAGVKY